MSVAGQSRERLAGRSSRPRSDRTCYPSTMDSGAGTLSGEMGHIPDTADAAATSKSPESDPVDDADPASSANVGPPLPAPVSDPPIPSTSQPSAGPSGAQDRSLRTRQPKSILSMWLPKVGQTFLQEAADSEAWHLFLQDWFAFELEVGTTNTTAVSPFHFYS